MHVGRAKARSAKSAFTRVCDALLPAAAKWEMAGTLRFARPTSLSEEPAPDLIRGRGRALGNRSR